jgi:hypothetical protein
MEENMYTVEGGFAYTLASGKMFCQNFGDFQEWCEKLLGRPIWTHEFARQELTDELQAAWEKQALEALEKM